jgi:hypothetical protein
MIGKTVVGSGFSGVSKYVIEKEKSEILEQNNCFAQDPDLLAKQYRNVWAENKEISKPVWHSSISFSKDDKLSVEQMTDFAKDFLKKAGFTKENNQWSIILHKDTDTPHLHVIANRVGLDGKAVSDFYSKSNTVKWCKEIEKENGLVQVQEISKVKKMNKSLNPRKTAKGIIQEAIRELKGEKIEDFEDLKDKLKGKGIDMQINTHKNGNVFGASFKQNKEVFKGSQVGKEFAVKALSKMFGIPLEPIMKIIKNTDITKDINKGFSHGF